MRLIRNPGPQHLDTRYTLTCEEERHDTKEYPQKEMISMANMIDKIPEKTRLGGCNERIDRRIYCNF